MAKLKFGPPVERPKAEKWEPKKGQTKDVMLVKILKDGKFGTSYLVKDLDSEANFFLPNHGVLNSLVEAAEVKTGNVLRIKCLRKGSRKAGDYYDYEVRKAKGNAPF